MNLRENNLLSNTIEEVGTDEAYSVARRLARETGIFTGVSSGAAVAAALRLAARLDRGVIVIILCDTGLRYLDAAFWTADRATVGA